jgi:predicted nucleic acid-binding protein
MTGICLVDSSVWVEAGRSGGDPEIVARLADLVSSGFAAMTAPVWMELYQGIRGKREEARLLMTRSLCVWLEFDDDCWQQAARIARICLRSGVNVPFSDVLVFTCAARHRVELLERDRHFEMLRKAVKP